MQWNHDCYFCPDACMCMLCVCVIWQELNLAVVGSQVVGLVPLKAMLLSADYFMEKENLFLLEEDQKIRLVSFTLLTCPTFSGLRETRPKLQSCLFLLHVSKFMTVLIGRISLTASLWHHIMWPEKYPVFIGFVFEVCLLLLSPFSDFLHKPSRHVCLVIIH